MIDRDPVSQIFWGKMILIISALKYKLATQYGDAMNEMYSGLSGGKIRRKSSGNHANPKDTGTSFEQLYKLIDIQSLLSYISKKIKSSHCIELSVEDFIKIFEFNNYPSMLIRRANSSPNPDNGISKPTSNFKI